MAIFNVYARKWRVSYEQKTTSFCPSRSGVSGNLWSWTSKAVVEFQVTDAGGPVSGLTIVDGSASQEASETCLKNSGCTFALDSNWPRANVDAMYGTLDPARGIVFDIHYTDQASFVGFTPTCGGVTGAAKPSRAGASYHTGDLVLGPGGAEHKIPPDGDMDYEKWTLRPVSPCSP
jgi:hypothetical protein